MKRSKPGALLFHQPQRDEESKAVELKREHEVPLSERIARITFHGIALILVLGATSAAVVNRGLGWSPSPDLISNQVYDATILRVVKHLVDNPQVKLPYLAYEGALWLKSTTAAQVLLALMSAYLGVMLPGFVQHFLSHELFLKINRFILLSTFPALIASFVLHVVILPMPPPPTNLRHGDWASAYLQRMIPAFLAGWSVAVDRGRRP